jgi:hemolysin III
VDTRHSPGRGLSVNTLPGSSGRREKAFHARTPRQLGPYLSKLCHTLGESTAFETPELPDHAAPMIANPTPDMATTLRALARKELVADGVVHLIGIVAGCVGAAILVMAAATGGSPLELAALISYSGGLLAMLGCSAAYHLLRSSRRRELLRCFDHSAIFLMIAGTYTPFTLLRIKPLWAIVLTSLVWSIAALGIVLRLVRPQLFERLSIGFYLALGWAGLAAVGTLVPSVRLSTLVLLAAGGLLYTVGVVFHVRERLPFRTAIWHGFVLVAAAAHYVAVLDEIVVAHASV